MKHNPELKESDYLHRVDENGRKSYYSADAAKQAGARTLEIKGIDIINSDFKRIFGSTNGVKLMGFDVEYNAGKGFSDVTLLKNKPSRKKSLKNVKAGRFLSQLFILLCLN